MVAPLRALEVGDWKYFDVSSERGFLPSEDPLLELPARYAPWEEVAGALPKLLLSGRRARRILETLPVLSTEELLSEAALRRAMRILSFLGHAYVFSEETPAARIPAAIALPWCAVASRLGRPPVLSYASYALDNWRRLDPGGPIELGNLALLSNFLGGADEDWFVLVHIDIESRAARPLRELGPALAAARSRDAAGLAEHLHAIAGGIEALVAALQRMPDYCDPFIYYRRVRPWIHGWKDHPVLREGVIYEGVEEFGGRPQKFRGETGAQSGIVPALDGALGIAHGDDPLRTYLLEMRAYMPPGHRSFVAAIESGSRVRETVLAHAGAHPALVEAYDDCLHWLESFRTLHLEYAIRYIGRQSPSGPANPTDVGTGGTPFAAYLRKHRDDCTRHRVGGR